MEAGDVVLGILIHLLSCLTQETHTMPQSLSPRGVANVCSGEELEVRCTIGGGLLLWRSATLIPNGFAVQEIGNADDVVRQINSTTLTILRVSTSPLVSTLSLNPVTEALNGTEISCRDLDSPNSTSVTISVINSSVQNPQLEMVNVTNQPKYYGDSNITIILEWALESTLYSYNISVAPQARQLNFSSSTRAQLTLSYNTLYNISIIARHFCGNMSYVVTSFTVNYTHCGDVKSQVVDKSVNVQDSGEPAIEGSIVSFTCPAGASIEGPNTTECTDSGQWVPNPGEVACAGLTVSTFGISDVTIAVNDDNTSVIIGSLCTVLILVATLVVLVAVLCAIKAKRKAGFHGRVIYTQGELRDSSNNYSITDHSETIECGNPAIARSLVYAEIGPSSFSQRSHQDTSTRSIHALDLDDTPVEYAQLTHKPIVINEDQSAETENTSSTIEVNLDNLLVQLRSQVSSKWYEFGEVVYIERKILDSYAEQCNPDDCLTEVLDYWLRHSKTKPTWKDVSNVLRAIKLVQLAHSIEMVYTTGKLPVEVNMQWLPPDLSQDKSHPQDSSAAQVENPPPVPPKTMASTQLQFGMEQQEGYLQQTHLKISVDPVYEEENSTPTLPPKPSKFSGLHSAPDVPARPPKRIN